jgi:hypothetical protein
MSVKKLLEQQAVGYITLHEVLTRMTKIDGATYQEAATVLHRALWSTDRLIDRPGWYVCDKLRGRIKATNREEGTAWDCLKYVAEYGTEVFDDDIPF